MDTIHEFWKQIVIHSANYAPKALLAIITLIVGLWLIRKIKKILNKIMDKRNVDISLRPFLLTMIAMGLKILLIISVISMVGIETTSFIAILASVGFAVGMALQGSLSNFAGGVLILFFRPFRVSDFIEAQGFTGTVQTIQIFNTIILTPDNKRIIVPNGILSNNPIINYTAEPIRRLDLSFGIGYNDDVEKAKAVIKKVIDEDVRIKKEPECLIALGMLADSSVNLTVRVWCDTSDYWDINFWIHEKIKKEFDLNGISIPFPQRDIHVYNHSEGDKGLVI